MGNVTTQQNYLAVSSCNQNLRLNFQLHTTDLVFNIFSAKEVRYSDANVCVDSTALIPLIDSNTNVNSVTNFDFSNLGLGIVVIVVAVGDCARRVGQQTDRAFAVGVIIILRSRARRRRGAQRIDLRRQRLVHSRPVHIAHPLQAAGGRIAQLQHDIGTVVIKRVVAARRGPVARDQALERIVVKADRRA
ncbi:MAG: hypothetical protein WAK03_06840, partial [Methylocystis sp.]